MCDHPSACPIWTAAPQNWLVAAARAGAPLLYCSKVGVRVPVVYLAASNQRQVGGPAVQLEEPSEIPKGRRAANVLPPALGPKIQTETLPPLAAFRPIGLPMRGCMHPSIG